MAYDMAHLVIDIAIFCALCAIYNLLQDIARGKGWIK